MYKTFPTNRRPLPLDVDSHSFASVWKACAKNKQSDLTKLLQMMEPVFERWEVFLLRVDHNIDINFLTLCRMLSKNPDIALYKIDNWIKWAKSSSSIKEELQLIFLERIRKIKYTPDVASDVMVEYVVARDFKRALHHHIRAINRLKFRDCLFYADIFDEIVVETYTNEVDIWILDRIKSNKWNSYLFHLITEGYTSRQRSELTRIHRRTLYNEEKKLCQLLKPKP
jgi:hypothetical protein